MITRRDWWIGIALVTAALLAHAVWPRYVWRQATSIVFVREDRWRGTLERGAWDQRGRWISVRDQPARTAPVPGQTPQILSFEPAEESTSPKSPR